MDTTTQRETLSHKGKLPERKRFICLLVYDIFA